MRKFATLVGAAALAALGLATTSLAADTDQKSTTAPAPAATTTTPAPAATIEPAAATEAAAKTMTEAEAKAWVDKVVYSSDGKNVGEVAAITRDGSNNVTELHADVGGFLGLGETRVKILPSQFKLGSDRVNLALTSEEIKKLPHLPK